jgi:hypothetical protein
MYLPYHHNSESQQIPHYLINLYQAPSTLHHQLQLPPSSSMPRQSLSATRPTLPLAIYQPIQLIRVQPKKPSKLTTNAKHDPSVLVPGTWRIQLHHRATYQSYVLATVHFPVYNDAHADAKACRHGVITGTATRTTEISVELQDGCYPFTKHHIIPSGFKF